MILAVLILLAAALTYLFVGALVARCYNFIAALTPGETFVVVVLWPFYGAFLGFIWLIILLTFIARGPRVW